MLHQPSGGTMGKASDIAIEAKEIIRMRQRLNETFARETGQTAGKGHSRHRTQLLDVGRRGRDLWLSA